MSVFVAFTGRRRRFMCDESGSAHIEWIMAVALVVLAAIPVMSMVGKGSETRSGKIAISIAEAELPVEILPEAASDEVPEPGAEALSNPSAETEVAEAGPPGFGPGADLGVGFSGGADIRGGDYRRISARRTGPAQPILGELRRDKPTGAAGRPADPSSVAAAQGMAPEKAGISLPSLPSFRVGFAANACLDPIDRDSISDARFEPTEVVASGR